MTPAPAPDPVAFVLPGGAGLGAIQVGMLRALAVRGVVPDMLVATSVGAIHGAFIASHGPTSEFAGLRNVLHDQPMDFGHAAMLGDRAEADACAFLDDRAGTVVPLRRTRGRRGHASGALAELAPAG